MSNLFMHLLYELLYLGSRIIRCFNIMWEYGIVFANSADIMFVQWKSNTPTKN